MGKISIQPRSMMAAAAIFFAIVMVVLAIIGGYHNYSPIPHWDMWDGTVNFNISIADGKYDAWWGQHNEHRIILSRILFWIDYHFFDGNSIFLIAINYILAGLAAILFLSFLRETTVERRFSSREILLGSLIVGSLFLWVQVDNFIWAFQSQFFLAQLIPLCALYFLAKSVGQGTRMYFILASSLGILAAGTMANGVLTLPLMFLYAVALRQGKVRSGILLALSFLVNYLYFTDYHAPSHHGNLMTALRHDPLGLLHYTLLYLGSPFYYLLGMGSIGRAGATIAGLLLIISSAWVAISQFPKTRRSPYTVALLFFITYIGGTAFGTGGGRLVFGLEQALTSRYSTPALMVYAALLIALSASLRGAWVKAWNTALPGLGLLAGLLMLSGQAKALASADTVTTEKRIAALALTLGIKDDEYIGKIHPDSAHALGLTKSAVEKRFSVFGRYPYVDLLQQIGKPTQISPTVECQGALDKVDTISGVKDYVRIQGWIFNRNEQTKPDRVVITQHDGTVIGFALTGITRHDVASAIDAKAERSGFVGYMKSSAIGTPILALGTQPDCRLGIQTKIDLISVTELATWPIPQASQPSVNIDSVRANQGWAGADFQKSSIKGLAILGSFVNSDADTGMLTLHVKKGDHFLYRSGPTAGNQFLKIAGEKNTYLLSVATEWVSIELSAASLPDQFDIQLSDEGNAWGEWSAIALKVN